MPFVMGDDWGCGVKPELRFAFSLFSINAVSKPAETLFATSKIEGDKRRLGRSPIQPPQHKRPLNKPGQIYLRHIEALLGLFIQRPGFMGLWCLSRNLIE